MASLERLKQGVVCVLMQQNLQGLARQQCDFEIIFICGGKHIRCVNYAEQMLKI